MQRSWLLPAVLSTTAGAVDVIGFLTLEGLFTAHISGNVCVLAAHHITGGFSHAGPLLSVPVFIAVLGVVTLAFGRVEKASDGSRRVAAGAPGPARSALPPACGSVVLPTPRSSCTWARGPWSRSRTSRSMSCTGLEQFGHLGAKDVPPSPPARPAGVPREGTTLCRA